VPSIFHEPQARRCGATPSIIPETAAILRHGHAHDRDIAVLAGPLGEAEWEMLRAFVRRTSREALRLRFGQTVDFTDDRTLRRFFDVAGRSGEMVWMLEEGGAICGIVHLVRLSPRHAEIALIVRSHCARRGIGERLLRAALERAAKQGLAALSALVLYENIAMLRLARKVGFEPRQSLGLAVALEFDLDRLRRGGNVASAYTTAPSAPIGAAVR
jgi:RimJ/RimL family protein N-acetyltransferase